MPNVRSRFPIWWCAVLLGVLGGCTDVAPTGQAPEDADLRISDSSPSSRLLTFDDELAAIAREHIPGFAGYYLDGKGNTVVRLVDLEHSDIAGRFLTSAAVGLAKSPSDLIYESATYDFLTLKEWSDQLVHLLERDDVFTLDIDEVANQVRVGVESPSAIEAVEGYAKSLEVPSEALEIEVQGRPAPRILLTDQAPVLQGGWQIATQLGSCAFGFNAIRNGVVVFITNSHCSLQKFALDNTVQYQPYVSAPLAIGHEIADPGLRLCGPPNRQCRMSDAAVFQHNGNRGVGLWQIARTTFWRSGQRGSVEIDSILPYFNIVQKITNNNQMLVGYSVHKVGPRSGWTTGHITQTCVRIGQLDCQWVTRTYSEHGDSGSPIFQWRSDDIDRTTVGLHGLLWGGPTNDYHVSYYSPMSGIQADIGVLTAP